MMTQTMELEKIQTGLTANYVPGWTVVQGLKEAMQNIAYGSVKSGKDAKLYYDSTRQMWAIRDKYIGFGKENLYIGESEQRGDKDGLGTFGEGWKIFLLVMARNEIKHRVSTVGYDFWGTMEPTVHGPEVLVINIEPNLSTNGTTAYANVPEEMWRLATESFAVLQGISTDLLTDNNILPGRNGELWVKGVRIEDNDEKNPLKLHYSYNLNQRELINRDRSHVNTLQAYGAIKQLIWHMEEADIKEYLSLALRDSDREDVLGGPWVPVHECEQKPLWLNALAEAHACNNHRKLIMPSYNQAVNSEAKKKGYTLLDTPRKWEFELSYLGIKKADDVINDQFDIVEKGYYGTSTEEKSALAKTRSKLKKAFKLSSVDELPPFQYVSEIRNPVSDLVKNAYYDKSIDTLYVNTAIMDSEERLLRNILPELVRWKYPDNWKDEAKYMEIIVNILY